MATAILVVTQADGQGSHPGSYLEEEKTSVLGGASDFENASNHVVAIPEDDNESDLEQQRPTSIDFRQHDLGSVRRRHSPTDQGKQGPVDSTKYDELNRDGAPAVHESSFDFVANGGALFQNSTVGGSINRELKPKTAKSSKKDSEKNVKSSKKDSEKNIKSSKKESDKISKKSKKIEGTSEKVQNTSKTFQKIGKKSKKDSKKSKKIGSKTIDNNHRPH